MTSQIHIKVGKAVQNAQFKKIGSTSWYVVEETIRDFFATGHCAATEHIKHSFFYLWQMWLQRLFCVQHWMIRSARVSIFGHDSIPLFRNGSRTVLATWALIHLLLRFSGRAGWARSIKSTRKCWELQKRFCHALSFPTFSQRCYIVLDVQLQTPALHALWSWRSRIPIIQRQLEKVAREALTGPLTTVIF